MSEAAVVRCGAPPRQSAALRRTHGFWPAALLLGWMWSQTPTVPPGGETCAAASAAEAAAKAARRTAMLRVCLLLLLLRGG